MNLLFSEGEHLFSYKDKDSHNGLWITERISPFGIVSLKDEDWEIDLAEEKHPDQRGYVIASHPLTKNEKWTDLTVLRPKVVPKGSGRGTRLGLSKGFVKLIHLLSENLSSKEDH